MATPYEREIEELLRSLGPIGPKETAGERFKRLMAARFRGWGQQLRNLPHTVPADQLMLAALLFVVAAYFLRFVLPGAARFVGLAGVILFIAAFAFSFNQLFGRSRNSRTWRGRQIDPRFQQPTLIDKFVYWVRRRMRGY